MPLPSRENETKEGKEFGPPCDINANPTPSRAELLQGTTPRGTGGVSLSLADVRFL
jgi:hypothetical protein